MKASTSAVADSSDNGQKSASTTSLSGKSPVQVARRNARERRRVHNVNLGFVKLRDHVPQYGAANKSKKLSKFETLRAAADYIKFLHQLLNSPSAAGGDNANQFALSQLNGCASQPPVIAYQQHQQQSQYHQFLTDSTPGQFGYYCSTISDSTNSVSAQHQQQQQLCHTSCYPQHSFCHSMIINQTQSHQTPPMISAFESMSPTSSSFCEPSPTSELSSSTASFSGDYSMTCSPTTTLSQLQHHQAAQHTNQEFIRFC